jgi:hypothetical protein
MPIIPFVSGQDTLSADFNAALDAVRVAKYQTVDLTRNNTVAFLDSSDLVIPLLANAVYVMESSIIYDSNTTADVQLRFALSAGSALLRIAPWGALNTATTATNAIAQQATDAASTYTVTLGGAGTGTMITARPTGIVTTAAVPANLVVGFAQAVANVSNTLLKQYSWLAVTRVA